MRARKREQRQRALTAAAVLLALVAAVVGVANAAQNNVDPSNAGVATGPAPTATPVTPAP